MAERRKFQRYEVLVGVQVTRDAEVHILKTRNVSMGGLFIEAIPMEYPELAAGSDVDVVIFAENAESEDDVRARARIVRVEAPIGKGVGGFALEFVNLDDENRQRLNTLLGGKTPSTD